MTVGRRAKLGYHGLSRGLRATIAVVAVLALAAIVLTAASGGSRLLLRAGATTSPGLLRVTSSPAVPTQVVVDGQVADSWGLAWLQLAPGTHTVSFTHVPGYSEPPQQSVTITTGATTTVTGNFVARGTLRVTTSPPVHSEVSVDGHPADDMGVWTDLPAGSHQVCFGAVAGYTPPACQTANVTAGNETDITGTFTSNAAAGGQAGQGMLRVSTTPAVPSQVTITPQGGSPFITDTWGLNWLELSPGTYTVAFGHVPGYTEPAPQSVTIVAGSTTTINAAFAPRGILRVSTNPALAATIAIDGHPADAWGVWTDLPTGSHQICFGAVAGYNTPACQTTTLTAGNEADVVGAYTAAPTNANLVACGLAQAAFCDTFDAPTTNGADSRSGALNGVVWGVSRVGEQNLPAPANGWAAVQLSTCGATSLVNPPNDVQVCNGQLVDTLNDAGSVRSLAMYPKQPFDFAGRTGKIVFDVSNDTQGNHAAWPELWVTDQPVPDPFTHEATWQALPRNGFGLRFAGCTDSSGNAGICSKGSGAVGVDSGITITNYAENDSFNGGTLKVIGLGSVMKSGPGQMNHYEVDVSQGQIDVFATDAYTPGATVPPLVHIAAIPSANLAFSRGLIWIEDVHYNANKFNTQRLHSFTWDNVGFDGPVLPRDLAFDVPDNTTPNANVGEIGLPGENLGWSVGANSSLTLTDHGITGISNAVGALLTFNFYSQTAPFNIQVAVNGNPISMPWPYADNLSYTPRTVAVPIPLADVHTGDNTITFTTGNYGLSVMNVDLIMQGAGGVVTP